MNDLFDLRMEPSQDNDREPVAANGVAEAVEKASEQGIECRHVESKDDKPIGDTKQLSVPERGPMVEVGKGHRSQSFRRCSEAGTARDHAGSKAEGKEDGRTGGRVGFGTVLDPAS